VVGVADDGLARHDELDEAVRVPARFFLHLAGRRGEGVFAVVHVAAGQLPDPPVHDEAVAAQPACCRRRRWAGRRGMRSGTVADVTLDDLAVRLREFAAARDWEQFHTPKNLAMALAGEVGELVAELQWLTPEEAEQVMADPEAAARMRAELADVTIYLVRLADVLGVDLIEAARVKLMESDRRYDVESYHGSARKAPPLS
jgi:NTP pyrophosphatase (non-canonical NTP hydrolase)